MFQHTAARRRLVGGLSINTSAIVFQHTAARRRLEIAKGIKDKSLDVSTHSRPKAAGRVSATSLSKMRFQHTAARRRLVFTASIRLAFSWFQHTAARRRLAEHLGMRQNGQACFNTQPPEGGWVWLNKKNSLGWLFQHTAARRRLVHVPI